MIDNTMKLLKKGQKRVSESDKNLFKEWFQNHLRAVEKKLELSVLTLYIINCLWDQKPNSNQNKKY